MDVGTTDRRGADVNAALSPEITHRVSSLHQRAESLRTQADALPELLARTYRRRAAELELEAWALEVRSGAGEPVAA
jgi:hypothetical protein